MRAPSPSRFQCSLVYFDVVVSVNVIGGTIVSADVVVVGSGGAALAAALAAHDAGATVAGVARAGAVGGKTAVSGGGVWMPGNHISAADDSREEALAYMSGLSRGRAPADQLARYVD